MLLRFGVVIFKGFQVCCRSSGCMATTVGVGPFGALTTVPTAAFQRSAGKPSRTTRSLRRASCHGVSFPAPMPSQRWTSGQFFCCCTILCTEVQPWLRLNFALVLVGKDLD